MKQIYLVVFSNGFTHEFEGVSIEFVQESTLIFCEKRNCTAKIYELKSTLRSCTIQDEYFTPNPSQN